MKVLKVIHDDDCTFIVDIVEKIQENIKVYIEEYNISDYRQRKKALPIMTRHGTKLVPLIVIENENLEEYAAIWVESNPDWHTEIIKILND